MDTTITKPQTPTERYRQRLQGLIEQKAELQAHFDKITSEGDDPEEQWQAMQDLDLDIGRAQATLDASIRADASEANGRRAAALAKSRRAAEEALTAYEDAALRAESRLSQYIDQWQRVEDAYKHLAAVTPDSGSMTVGGQAHKPVYLWQRLFLMLRQRIHHEIPRPMSISRPLEPLADLFGRKRASVLSWLGTSKE